MSQLTITDSILEVTVDPQAILLSYSIMLGIASIAVIAISVEHHLIWGGVIGLSIFGLSAMLLRWFLLNRKWRINLDDGEMYLVEGIYLLKSKSIRKYNIRQFSKAFYALTLNRNSVVYTVTISDIRGNSICVASSLGEQNAKKLVEIICHKFGLTNMGYIGL